MSFDVCGPGHQGRRTRAHGGPWGKAGGIRAELDLLIGRCGLCDEPIDARAVSV